MNKTKRLKHDYSKPFHGLGNDEILSFASIKIPLIEAKKLSNQELGFYIKEFDCPNCFHVLFERLWKECKYQGTSIMGSEAKAYEVFFDDMYVTVRKNIAKWNDSKKSGQFFGWCKAIIYRSFLNAIRLKSHKKESKKLSLNTIGEFTTISAIEFENGLYEDTTEMERNEEFQHIENMDKRVIEEMNLLEDEDRKLFYRVAVDRIPINKVSIEFGLDQTKVQSKMTKLKKILRQRLTD